MTDTYPRTAETIIADWLDSYNGMGLGADRYRSEAYLIIAWLRDEGWVITRK